MSHRRLILISRQLLKGRALPEGSIRTHGGIRKKKVRGKWIPIPSEKVVASKEESKAEVYGSRKGVQYSQDFLEILDKTYADIERITKGKFEAASVITSTGRRAFLQEGNINTPNMVDLHQHRADLYEAACMVHNHPTLDVSFSRQDIASCVLQQMSEIRVISKSYEYIFRPDYKERTPTGYLQDYTTAYNEVFGENSFLVGTGAMAREEAEKIHHHQVMIYLIEYTGGYYERRPRSKGLSKAEVSNDRRPGARARLRQRETESQGGEAIKKSMTWSGYKLQGRIKWQGLPISIENERGSMRRGEDADGHEWATFMHIPYGYIRLTEGVDGDHVDCYIGPGHDSDRVFVVHQNDPATGHFDEDKTMLGFRDALSARRAFIRQYDRPGFFGSMDEYSLDEFKELLKKRKGAKLKKSGLMKRFVEPPTVESLVDCSVRDSEVISDTLDSGSRPSEVDGLMDVPLKRPRVLSPVNALRDKLKIGDDIVKSVPVKMVNDLSGEKRSTKVSLHDDSMLKALNAGTVRTNESNQSVLGRSAESTDVSSHIRSSHDDPPKVKYNSSSKDSQGKKMSTEGGVPNGTLIKSSNDNNWYAVVGYRWERFYVYESGEGLLEKAKSGVKIKSYYSPDEVKARGMRWVTIRGARVLLQGTSDGGWVVVGGAGGKLNHLRVDNILSKEAYAKKTKEMEEHKKEGLRGLTQEELAEFREKRKAEVTEKRELRTAYTAKVRGIIGVTEEDLKSQITAGMMDEIADRARDIIETRKRKVLDESDVKDIEKEKEKIINQEAQKQIKNVERQALDVLMNDYLNEGDPNDKKKLKQMLDNDKAVSILQARRDFKKSLKDIGAVKDPRPPRLKIGDVFVATAATTVKDILDEVKQNVETAKNIELYDRINAQSGAINRHIAGGNASTINGILSDVMGGGATFSPDAFKELGADAIARAVAIEIQKTGRADAIKKALEEFSNVKREVIVTEAMESSAERLSMADSIRDLAKGTDDEEGLMTMAQANGYALKEMIAAQQDLGVAVGSLQAMAHLINAMEEPPADTVLVEMGSDLRRARNRAKKAGLKRGMYHIRKSKAGGKKLIMEIPAESMSQFITNNKEIVKKESEVDKIKKHKANTGMTAGDGNMPPGMNEHAVHPITGEEGPIHLDASQEAGMRFFREKGKVLLDFEAGMGKTSVAYAAMMDAIHNQGVKKILVVTPPKLCDQFKGEAVTFLDKENQKRVTNAKAKKGPKGRAEVYAREEGIHIIGHDQLASDWQNIKEGGYDMIVIDEVHQMTPGGMGKGSQRFRGMMQLVDIPKKIVMSGTNIKNGKVELYKKINFLDPDHGLGSIAAFEKRYKGLNQGTSAFQDSANDAFRKEMAQWVYTQKNTLPVTHEHEHIRVPLTKNQRDNLRQVMTTYRTEKEANKIGAAARRDADMYRVVHNDAEADNSKAGEIVKIMRQSHVGEKAAVHVTGLNAMHSTKKRLEREFGKGSVVAVSGQPPYDGVEHIRDAKAAFNDHDSPVKFIIGTKSMESGHNLQGGTVNFHLDQPMTFAAKDQREKRTFRKGQGKNVKTYTLSGHNPYDLRMEDIVKRKKRETEIMGNPQEIEGMDGSGFLSFLNKYEQEG